MNQNQSKPTLQDVRNFLWGLITKGEIKEATLATPYKTVWTDIANNCVRPISERFNFQRFNLHSCLVTRHFNIDELGDQRAAFSEKYSTIMKSDSFTLEDLCQAIYELTCILTELDKNRLTLGELNELKPGLGNLIFKLLEKEESQYDFLRSSEKITALLTELGLTPDEILIDQGTWHHLPLSTALSQISWNFEFADRFSG